MIRRACVGAILAMALALPISAASPGPGIITLDTPVPAYHADVTAHWALTRRPQLPAMGLLCYQGNVLHYGAELPLTRALTGSGTILLANETSSVLPGTLDYSQPASCQVYVFDDHRGGQPGEVITNVIGFTVPAGG